MQALARTERTGYIFNGPLPSIYGSIIFPDNSTPRRPTPSLRRPTLGLRGFILGSKGLMLGVSGMGFMDSRLRSMYSVADFPFYNEEALVRFEIPISCQALRTQQ